MRIDGQWRVCDDGIVRPVISGEVLSASGSWVPVPFLVDTGADCSVLSADIVLSLGLTGGPAIPLGGVGGQASSVLLDIQLRMATADGGLARFKAKLAGVNDPAALDMSVLGRDITNLFALIVDRPQEVVCLLGQNHFYEIRRRG